MPNLQKLITELAQPTMRWNTIGKLVIEKAPDDTKSPNMGDAVMIRFGRTDSIDIWERLAA
jgi:hypothetical protein